MNYNGFIIASSMDQALAFEMKDYADRIPPDLTNQARMPATHDVQGVQGFAEDETLHPVQGRSNQIISIICDSLTKDSEMNFLTCNTQCCLSKAM